MSQIKKIVFVTYGGGHVNMLIPVIKKLQKQSNLELVVLGLTTAGLVLKNNNIPYIGFKDLLNDNDYALKYTTCARSRMFHSAINTYPAPSCEK